MRLECNNCKTENLVEIRKGTIHTDAYCCVCGKYIKHLNKKEKEELSKYNYSFLEKRFLEVK